MSLVGEFELSFHIVESMWVLLDSIFTLVFFITFSFGFWWFDLLQEVVVAREEFLSVNFTDLTKWNVRDFVFKTTMNIDVIVGCPA